MSFNPPSTSNYHSSVKLHAPPGGKTSINLSWDQPSAPAPVKNTVYSNHQTSVSTQPPASNAFNHAAAPHQHPENGQNTTIYGQPSTVNKNNANGNVFNHSEAPVSANLYANRASPETGNFMTGRPTTRVHAPPGGASTIFLG